MAAWKDQKWRKAQWHRPDGSHKDRVPGYARIESLAKEALSLSERKSTWFEGSWLDIYYRKLATGFCFLIFMSGGLVGTFLILPLLAWWPCSAQKRGELRLGFVRLSFKAFMWCMLGARIMHSFRAVNRPSAADPPAVYIANHPTLMDVVAILSVLPRCNCIVKGELFRHPYMGGVLRGAGLIPNDGGPELLERIERDLACGRSLMIFPEGTRSPAGGLNPFNRGAARLVRHFDLPVVPIKVTCTPQAMHKGCSWYDTPARSVDFVLEFFPRTQPTATVDPELPIPRQVRAITRDWEQFYQRVLGITPPAADNQD